tara:strand:- start:642 stop:1715 length:1074 start_codon:yes stop_codon:yes gene_type:complete
MRVCILGLGLSALTLAKALVNQKIYVDLYYSNKNMKVDKSRTLGISNSNFNYFNNNIIKIEKISWKLNKIEIFNENLNNEKLLNFQNNQNHLFSIIKNFKLFDILNKSLINNRFFKKKKLKINIQDFKDYNLIINTDYSNIFTKKYFNKKIVKNYNSYAFTTIIKHEKIQNNVATQIFTKRGPIAFLPISKTETSIVYSISDSINKKVDLINLIHKYNFKYKINTIDNINFFELQSLTLRSYYNNNILAFGDLLHRIHPLAGQGFNMTIRDVKILTKIIKEKINLGLPIDSAVNTEFEKKTRHKNFIFSNGIDLIHEFFNLERKLNNSILTKYIKLIGSNPSLNKILTKIADKGITY